MRERIFKPNLNVTYSCHYHIVWCPKYRRKVLVDGVDDRLKPILQAVVAEVRNAETLALEVMPDHVHLLLDPDPHYPLHKLITLLKGHSSRLLRQEFPHRKKRLPTLWTNAYFVATTGGAPPSVIKQYVENQKRV